MVIVDVWVRIHEPEKNLRVDIEDGGLMVGCDKQTNDGSGLHALQPAYAAPTCL